MAAIFYVESLNLSQKKYQNNNLWEMLNIIAI